VEQTPNLQIRLSSFEKLKPWFVKRLNEFNSCCCSYHVQMVELKDGYNSMWTRLFHQNYICPCKICRPLGEAKCVANSAIAIGVRNLCDQILCLKEEIDEFHKLQYIQGDCCTCGILTLPICPYEVDVSVEVTIPWQ
jgi:hypothetical protein